MFVRSFCNIQSDSETYTVSTNYSINIVFELSFNGIKIKICVSLAGNRLIHGRRFLCYYILPFFFFDTFNNRSVSKKKRFVNFTIKLLYKFIIAVRCSYMLIAAIFFLDFSRIFSIFKNV